MQIQSANTNFISHQNKNIGFKSVYPVRVWVREMGGGYAPVATRDLTKTLTTKIINILNKSRAELSANINELEALKAKGEAKALTEMRITRLKIATWIKDFISKYDKDYALQNGSFFESPHTRAFYINGGYYKNHFNPCAYLMTGKDAKFFDLKYGKPIGLSIKQANGYKTAEYDQACNDYWQKGLNYVKKYSKEFKINDVPSELHIKMETVRAKTGNIRGYNITGIGFFPQNGPQNPLKLTEWLKK